MSLTYHKPEEEENGEGHETPMPNGLTTSGADGVEGFAVPCRQCPNRRSLSEDEKREFWKLKKAEKKLRKKAKAAARQEALKAEWETLPEEERERRKAEAAVVHQRRREFEERVRDQGLARLQDPHTPVLVFDLSFAWCMTAAQTRSTVSQLKFSYSALCSSGFPFRPVITSLVGREEDDTEHDAATQAALLASLASYAGFAKAPPQITERQHWSDLFPVDRVVYLTADAEEVLEDIEDEKVYVIGAFVDHNQHKGLSRSAAERHGVRMARLPIKESIDLSNRCLVLTINHVVDVLTRFVEGKAANAAHNGGDHRGEWKAALESALPVRRVQQEALGSRKRRRQRVSGTGTDTSPPVSLGDLSSTENARGLSEDCQDEPERR